MALVSYSLSTRRHNPEDTVKGSDLSWIGLD